MTGKLKPHLVQPERAPDVLDELATLYVAVTGRQPTPNELEEAREMLEATESLPAQRP